MRAAKLKVPAQEQFSRRPPDLLDRMWQGALKVAFGPAGNPKPQIRILCGLTCQVGDFRMSVYVSMQLRAQAQVCLERERKPALKQSLVLALVA